MAQMDHSIRLLSHGVARDRQSASFLSFPERPHGEQPQVGHNRSSNSRPSYYSKMDNYIWPYMASAADDSMTAAQRDKHAQLEAELAEVRRRWGESRDAFAARAVSDRDEIERLTSAVNDQEKALLLQLQVRCHQQQVVVRCWCAHHPSPELALQEGLQAAAARAQAAQTQQQLQILQAENQQLKASLGTKQTVSDIKQVAIADCVPSFY